MASVTFVPWAAGSFSFSNGNTLDYASTGKWCMEVRPNGRMTDIVPVTAPGRNGAGTQYFGGGKKGLVLKVVYVYPTEDQCLSNFQTDSDALADGVFTVALNSGTPANGCILAEQPQASQPKSTARGTVRMEATFSITCLRP